MADFLHNTDETLLRYLDGEMDQTEKKLFEDHIQHDSELKERLQSLQIAIASVQQFGTTEKVRSIHSEMMQELAPLQRETRVMPMRKIVRYGLAIAASIIIVFVGINIFSSQPSAQKLYNEAFVDYDASGVRGNSNETTLSKQYQNHQYKSVIAQAGSQNVSQRDSLLVGISYLKANQTSDATNWLKAVSPQSAVKQDAEFYLAMAYLKNENYKEAGQLMEQIHSNANHVYHNQFSDDYIARVEKLASR
jgi:hypothetical protein